MLAVMLPATALVVFGVYHLRNIQRDKAIEAAIQRDYREVLTIAEKRIDERAYENAEQARQKFPDMGGPDEIDDFLADHSDISYAFLWTGKGSMAMRSQSRYMQDAKMCAESRQLTSDFGSWMDLEAKTYIHKLSILEKTEGRRVYFTDHWISRGDKMQFVSLVFFLPPGSTPDNPALGGFLYDTDYLKNRFFPQGPISPGGVGLLGWRSTRS
jgi:hypothetical protein